MSSKLKEILLQESGLLSLSQSDFDLFLIGQVNAITYRQLALTGLHGSTATGGRLSIKRLEKEGYVASRFLPGNAREKYYILTAKGRKRIEKLFDGRFLEKMSFQLEKRPPLSQQQLPHRIHTGDIYFSCLANKLADQLPVWQTEVPYDAAADVSAPPRCDGLLQTGYGSYYIEQDDGTQGDTALKVKLSQYLKSGLFLGKNAFAHSLIFTMHTEARERPVGRPPYSVYRILLKAIRVWNALEEELGQPLTFNMFCMQFEANSSPNLCHLSQNDRSILRNLAYRTPGLSLNEVKLLKNSFLYDTSQKENRCTEQDALFLKRLQARFYALADSREQDTLRYRMRQGMRLWVLPNHRLSDYLPFALWQEYRLPDFLEKLLFHMGLHDLSLWSYDSSSAVAEPSGKSFLFYNVFSAESGIRIIAEDIAHDLGGRERVKHYLKTHTRKDRILFLLFVASREDAVLFLEQLSQTIARKENQGAGFCFLDKSLNLYEHPENHCAYFRKDIPTGSLWLPAMLDYDAFLGELALTERQVSK